MENTITVKRFMEFSIKIFKENFMDKTIEIILNLIDKQNISIHAFEKSAGIAISSIQAWKNGKSKPSADAIKKIADYFNVSIDYLYGRTALPNNLYNEEILTLPILAGVAAGFNHKVDEMESGEFIEVPRSAMKGYDKDDLLVLRVDGDSMFPTFQDGDKVLVVKQTSVDSGSIAVVCYEDYENGTIKKVSYSPNGDYVDLIPLNPKYQPVRITDAALNGVRVIGKVIYLFREV